MSQNEFLETENQMLRTFYRKFVDGKWQEPLRVFYHKITDSDGERLPLDIKSETVVDVIEPEVVDELDNSYFAKANRNRLGRQVGVLGHNEIYPQQLNHINIFQMCPTNLPYDQSAANRIKPNVVDMPERAGGKKERPNASVIARQFMIAVAIKIYNEAIYIWISTRYVLMTMLNFKRVLNSYFRHQAEIVGTAKLYDNIIEFLLCEERLVVNDSDRKIVENKVAFNDGYLDIPTMKLMPPDPRLFFMLYLNINVQDIGTNTNTPRFDRFLSAVTGGDTDLQARIMEMIGYCLSNDMNAKAFFLLQGVSNSGKSTLINLLSSFFTDDLLAAVALEEIGAQFAVCELFGKALNINGELGAGSIKVQNARQLKVLTGNDLVSADVKYKSRVRFRNTAKMIFATNNPLYLEVNDEALLERIVVIPFAFSIPNEVRNHNLVELLKVERGGIFWKSMVAYNGLRARNYKFSGNFQLNAVCQQSSRSIAAGVVEVDYLKIFLEENLFAAPDSGVFLSDVLAAFDVWLKEKGIIDCKRFSDLEFGKAMRKYLPETAFTKKRKMRNVNPTSYLVGYRMKEV